MCSYSYDTYILTCFQFFHFFRLFWLAVCIAALSCFIVLIGEKVQLMYQYPKSINLNIIYNNTLPFPAVTICNLNPYRYFMLE